MQRHDPTTIHDDAARALDLLFDGLHMSEQDREDWKGRVFRVMREEKDPESEAYRQILLKQCIELAQSKKHLARLSYAEFEAGTSGGLVTVSDWWSKEGYEVSEDVEDVLYATPVLPLLRIRRGAGDDLWFESGPADGSVNYTYSEDSFTLYFLLSGTGEIVMWMSDADENSDHLLKFTPSDVRDILIGIRGELRSRS